MRPADPAFVFNLALVCRAQGDIALARMTGATVAIRRCPLDRPSGWIPRLYDPLLDPSQHQIRAAFSGEF